MDQERQDGHFKLFIEQYQACKVILLPRVINVFKTLNKAVKRRIELQRNIRLEKYTQVFRISFLSQTIKTIIIIIIILIKTGLLKTAVVDLSLGNHLTV